MFPVLQQCIGGQVDWADVASEGSSRPPFPAPTVTVFKNGTLQQAASSNGAPSDYIRYVSLLGFLAYSL